MARKRIPGIVKPPNRRRPVRPQRMPTIASFPKGPRLYAVPQDQQIGTNGPGDPPPGFISPTNSITEWWVYFALSKVLGFPKDPRNGPFVGWPGLWTYQVPFETNGIIRSPGSQVIDFTVESNPLGDGAPIALRIQTFYYHGQADAVKQGREQLLRQRLAGSYVVRDIWETSFLNDTSGQGVIIAVKGALGGIEQPSPLRGGTLFDVQRRPSSSGS